MDIFVENHYPDPGSVGSLEASMSDRNRGRNSQPTTEKAVQETLSRTRRIETRLTQLMIGLGIVTEAQRPTFADGRLELPSPHTSLKEIIDTIPETWIGPVELFMGAERVGVIDRGD